MLTKHKSHISITGKYTPCLGKQTYDSKYVLFCSTLVSKLPTRIEWRHDNTLTKHEHMSEALDLTNNRKKWRSFSHTHCHQIDGVRNLWSCIITYDNTQNMSCSILHWSAILIWNVWATWFKTFTLWNTSIWCNCSSTGTKINMASGVTGTIPKRPDMHQTCQRMQTHLCKY